MHRRGRNNTWLCAERVKVRLLVLAVVCCFVALSGQSYLPTAFKWILWRSPGIMIIIIWPLLITLLWPGRDKKDDYKSWRWASGGILFERERERDSRNWSRGCWAVSLEIKYSSWCYGNLCGLVSHHPSELSLSRGRRIIIIWLVGVGSDWDIKDLKSVLINGMSVCLLLS